MNDDYVRDWLDQQGIGKGIKTIKGLRRYRTMEKRKKEGKIYKSNPSYLIKGQYIQGVTTNKMSRAVAAISRALKSGKIKKPDVCQQCESPGPLEAHHFDYDKPLEVWWLCLHCHVKKLRGINWKD